MHLWPEEGAQEMPGREESPREGDHVSKGGDAGAFRPADKFAGDSGELKIFSRMFRSRNIVGILRKNRVACRRCTRV